MCINWRSNSRVTIGLLMSNMSIKFALWEAFSTRTGCAPLMLSWTNKTKDVFTELRRKWRPTQSFRTKLGYLIPVSDLYCCMDVRQGSKGFFSWCRRKYGGLRVSPIKFFNRSPSRTWWVTFGGNLNFCKARTELESARKSEKKQAESWRPSIDKKLVAVTTTKGSSIEQKTLVWFFRGLFFYFSIKSSYNRQLESTHNLFL